MDKPVIIARKVCKEFGETVKTRVLFDIDLEVNRGAFTAIIGPSGSGKSTFLNMLSFLERPSRGEIEIDGTMLSKLSGNAVARFRNTEMGFVFQFHYLLPEFTALENVLMPVWIRSGGAGKEAVEKAAGLMNRIGLEKSMHKFPAQMSGGQQQRVAIARALMNDPKILFADEPTGNLDRETGGGVLELLKEIVREHGTTLVMVTHDRDIALKADYIVELVDGRICRKFDLSKASEKSVREKLIERACKME